MSIQHLISIDREAKLSIDTGRLKITFQNAGETHFIAACDIAVLILANPCISLSLAVYQELAKNGAVIITAGEKYMPCAMSVPVGVNIDGSRRPFLQAQQLHSESAGQCWAQLLSSKVSGQALVASAFAPELAERLKLIAKHIEPGDKECREAQAAQLYWPEFFKSLDNPIDFRDKQGATDPVNIALNYGYAVLRAIVARGLAGAGLCLNFDVGHCRKDNPFNLADDFIEPFRFLADRAVYQIFRDNQPACFDKEIKKQLLSALLASTITIAGKTYRLFQGVDFAINSYCLSLQDTRRKLLLPNLPARPGKAPDALLWQATQFPYETQ